MKHCPRRQFLEALAGPFSIRSKSVYSRMENLFIFDFHRLVPPSFFSFVNVGLLLSRTSLGGTCVRLRTRINNTAYIWTSKTRCPIYSEIRKSYSLVVCVCVCKEAVLYMYKKKKMSKTRRFLKFRRRNWNRIQFSCFFFLSFSNCSTVKTIHACCVRKKKALINNITKFSQNIVV